MQGTCVGTYLYEEQGKINPAQIYIICGSSCGYFCESVVATTASWSMLKG